MYTLANSRTIIILIFMGFTFFGCLTSKVNDMVGYRPLEEKLVKIKNANLLYDNEIDIVLTAKREKKKKEWQYNIHLNIDSITALNKYVNSSYDLSPDEKEKTGVNRVDFYKQNDTSFYLVYLSGEEIFNVQTDNENINSINIMDKIKTDLNYKYIGFDSENQITFTYFPEKKDYNYIAFAVGTKWQENKWAYLLYPFSVAIDIITFPVQFIFIIKNYGKTFKS